MTIIEIIFWLLLADSTCAIIAGWTPLGERFREVGFIKRYMPLTQGWTLWYLVLVAFIGYLIYYA